MFCYCSISCGSVCYQSKLVTVGTMQSDIKVFSFSEEEIELPKSRALPIKLNVPNFLADLEDENDW